MKLSSSVTAMRRLCVSTMAFLVLVAAILNAQEPGRRNARDVHLRIETDRRTYRFGDSIAVRVSLRNMSPTPVRFVTDPPVLQARLRVYDAGGARLEPAFPPVMQDIVSRRPMTLGAGQTIVLQWMGAEWLHLRDWGYDLRTPGRYTIVGLPGVVGPELTPDYETVRSNRATFTITP